MGTGSEHVRSKNKGSRPKSIIDLDNSRANGHCLLHMKNNRHVQCGERDGPVPSPSDVWPSHGGLNGGEVHLIVTLPSMSRNRNPHHSIVPSQRMQGCSNWRPTWRERQTGGGYNSTPPCKGLEIQDPRSIDKRGLVYTSAVARSPLSRLLEMSHRSSRLPQAWFGRIMTRVGSSQTREPK